MKEVSQAGAISVVTQRSSLRWVSLGFPRLKWQCFQPVMKIAPVTVIYVVYGFCSILFVFYSFTRPLVCLTTNKSNCFTQLPSRLTPTPTATVPLGGKVTDPCQGTRQGGIRKYCAAAGKV